jgi:hypothetical protein
LSLVDKAANHIAERDFYAKEAELFGTRRLCGLASVALIACAIVVVSSTRREAS